MNDSDYLSYEPPITTEKPFQDDDYKYLIVPLVVIVVVTILSILVYLMVRKRRMTVLRHNLLSLYDFDSNEEEWDSLNSYDNPYYSGELAITNL